MDQIINTKGEFCQKENFIKLRVSGVPCSKWNRIVPLFGLGVNNFATIILPIIKGNNSDRLSRKRKLSSLFFDYECQKQKKLLVFTILVELHEIKWDLKIGRKFLENTAIFLRDNNVDPDTDLGNDNLVDLIKNYEDFTMGKDSYKCCWEGLTPLRVGGGVLDRVGSLT